MKGKLAFVVGAGVGYLFGTRAGRQQFEKIKGWATETWNDPRVQGYVHDTQQQATEFAKTQGAALKDKAVHTARSRFGSGEGGEPTSDAWEPTEPIVDADDTNPQTPRA